MAHQSPLNHTPTTTSHINSHNPAQAVQYVCRLLRRHGVGQQLTPEGVRQAKFAAESAQPLLSALHDLALLVLAGFPPNADAALARLRQQLQQEALQDEADAGLSQPGRALLLHCLAEWGCPAGLLAQLTLPQPSSRAALLALCWLVAHAQLFDRALEQLQVPQQLLPLLPPYPQDTSLTPEAQSHYHAAATAAQQHLQHIQHLLQQQQQQQCSTPAGTGTSMSSSRRGSRQSSSSSPSVSCWPAVQTAAHHVLATYRAATLRLQQLTCLAEAREKLLREIQQAQQGQQGPGSSSSSSRLGGKGAAPLTAFELHLLSRPALLQKHQEALQQAVSLLQQQEECRHHAAVFFAWAASAVAESQQQLLQGGTPATPTPSSSSSSAVANKQRRSLQQQQSGHAAAVQPVLPAPALQDVLPLAQQLPPADSQLAAGVLAKVQKQLAAAAIPGILSSAGADSSADSAASISSSPSAAAATGVDRVAADLGGCSLGSAVLGVADGQGMSQQVTAGFAQAAAAALVQAGVTPDASIPQLQLLPGDLEATLRQLQEQRCAEEQQQESQAVVLQQVLRHSSLARQCQQQGRLGTSPQRQQQQQQGSAPHLTLAAEQAAAVGSGLGVGCSGQQGQGQLQQRQQQARTAVGAGEGVHVADELQRLNGLALLVAKQLAKARAANKQQLAGAAQLLLEAGSGEEADRQLVLYQP